MENNGDDGEENAPPNGGTLILPADIARPQDVNLLNRAREKLERTVDEISKSTGRKKLRMYHRASQSANDFCGPAEKSLCT